MAMRRRLERREAQLAFEALAIEGGLLSPDWLARVAKLEAGSQAEADYRVPKGLNLRDEMGRYWRIAQAYHHEACAAHAGGADLEATSKREMTGMLREVFGFGSLAPTEPLVVADRSYPIGHVALGKRVPVVIAPQGVGLDTPLAAFGDGSRRRSAFGLAQEYLNAAEDAMWGIATDGSRLRILRDNASLTRPAWIEVDLDQMFGEDRYSDFAALWLIAHETRFGRADQPASECALEAWRSAGREEGTRAREHLRRGVEDALRELGQGFLSHPENGALRAAYEARTLTKERYFQQLLRLVYRLIFVLTAEERELLHASGADEAAKKLYADGYGLKRLRERSTRRSAHDRFSDLWQSLKITFRGLAKGEAKLGLPALAGIFADDQCADLDGAKLENRWLLQAIFRLSWLRAESGLERVNWRDMGPEELGSVYESLLELVPQITEGGRTFSFASGAETKGNERKKTGSYYTPDSLVQVLLDSALEPVIEQTIAANPTRAVDALLELSIVDPACGSGHFLLAAARRLAAHVARIQANGTPSAAEYRHALRQVVSRCIYGVDLNPMAVELCKVSLWMEAVEPGRPLSFLDAHIQQGNALLGTTPELMAGGVPDAAWEAIEGDDKKVASALKKRNKAAAKGEQGTFHTAWVKKAEEEKSAINKAIAELESGSEDDLGSVAKKEERWEQLLLSDAYGHQRFVADAWCAAFVWPKQPGPLAEAAPTNDLWCEIRSGAPAPELTVKTVKGLAREYSFFHWHLQFPRVFERGGFDVVLGNPPWDQVQFREPEFFAHRAPELAGASPSKREEMINALEGANPGLLAEYKIARRQTSGSSHFWRRSEAFPLTGAKRLNLYSIFAEKAAQGVEPNGRAGLVLPSGIATDDNSSAFFAHLLSTESIISLYEFNNSGFFPDAGAGHVNRFALLTLGRGKKSIELLFRGESIKDIGNPERVIELPHGQIYALNPNTPTCPVLTSSRDAAILAAAHKNVPPLLLEGAENGNPWKLQEIGTFNMSDDSHLFTEATEGHLPLYEAKMFSLFDHRFGDYGALPPGTDSHILPRPSEDRHNDPTFRVTPKHRIPEAAVRTKLRDWPHRWVISWRDTTNDANARTCVIAILGDVAVARNNAPSLFPMVTPSQCLCLVSSLSSFIVDFCCRKKLGGTHLTRGAIHQLPVLPPHRFEARPDYLARTPLTEWIAARGLELAYTAWDLEGFARDTGCQSPPFTWNPERRTLLRAELDALFLHLYGIDRSDADYVLDSFDTVRSNDERTHGEYRTKRLILEVYDAMAEAMRTGKPYQTLLDPPPADPRVAHPESTRPSWAKKVPTS